MFRNILLPGLIYIHKNRVYSIYYGLLSLICKYYFSANSVWFFIKFFIYQKKRLRANKMFNDSSRLSVIDIIALQLSAIIISMLMELKSVLHIVKHCSKFRVNYQTLVYFYHLLQESADERRPLNASSEFTKVTKVT